MPLTEELTFQLGDSGVTLNTDTASVPFVDIDKVFGLDNAPYRETHRDHEGTDGGFMDAEYEQGRTIVLSGTAYCDTGSVETYLDSLKSNYAPSRTVIPFYFKAPGVDERVLFVKPLGCKYDWEQARRTGRTRIQFKMFAEDPRLYTADLVSVNVPFAEEGTIGFGFNLSFNLDFGGSSGTDGVFVTNSGNRSTPPLFTINGPCTSPVIRDDTYGHVLTFNITLAAGETLVVDPHYKTVKLNGVTSRRSTLADPDWFFLEPGDTFIRYSAASGAGSSLDIEYRAAWR
jgi:hypothetical protein